MHKPTFTQYILYLELHLTHMVVNSVAALQLCMWIAVCSCVERNNISRCECAASDTRVNITILSVRSLKTSNPPANEMIVSSYKWVTVSSSHRVQSHPHRQQQAGASFTSTASPSNGCKCNNTARYPMQGFPFQNARVTSSNVVMFVFVPLH